MSDKTLDRYDINILSVLQEEGRISKRALAERINLSPTPCLMRMHDLEKKGYIEGYYADINYERLGEYKYFTINICLSSHQGSERRRFEDLVGDIPEIIDCDGVVGSLDYILTVLVKDEEHCDCVMSALLGSDISIASYKSYQRTKLVKRMSDNSIVSLNGAVKSI